MTSVTTSTFSALDVPFPSGGVLKVEGYFPFISIGEDVRISLFNALMVHDPLLLEDPKLQGRVSLPTPPYDYLKDVGAHISIIDYQEESLLDFDKLEAFTKLRENTQITFDKVIGVKKLDATEFCEHLWILELESKQLEDLREKELGLSRRPNYNKFNFHLSIAEVPWPPSNKSSKKGKCSLI